PLSEINAGNVKNLALAWTYRANPAGASGDIRIKSTPLQGNGVLYFTAPDHAWAGDALIGNEIWHFRWETTGGIPIAHRGYGMYSHWLCLETPDCFIVSIDARTGKLRWSKQIADVKQEYFCTPAPMIIRNHVLTGVGGDSLDVPGYLESRDPETGDLQWR